MIEFLVALFVVSIGLLGLAGLQITGVRSVNDASARTTASFLTSQIGEQMLVRGSAGAAALSGFVSDSTAGKYDSPSCAYTSNSLDGGVDKTLECFYSEVKNSLPGGNAKITRNAAAGTYTITVGWVDLASDTAKNIAWTIQP